MDALEEVRQRRKVRPECARALRAAAKVSQDAVARSLGVSKVTVARWESGDRQPSGEHLRAYAALLDRLERETKS